MNKFDSKYMIFSISIALNFFVVIHTVLASIVSYTTDADGITCTLDKGFMKVKICKEDVVEVKYTSLTSFTTKTSLVVANLWTTQPQFQVTEDSIEIIISTGKLKIKLNKLTNSIQYTELSGALILAEDDSVGKKMTAATIAGINTYNCETLFQSPLDEALFGLGCHPIDAGAMNYKGRNQDMAIQYMTGAIPVLLSNKGYGLMWDNYSASNFYGADGREYKIQICIREWHNGRLLFFLWTGFRSYYCIYRETTGPGTDCFPNGRFGLFQSQDRYQSQAEVLSVKNNYRNNHIPVDCIVQDWYYWYPNVIGSHMMYPANYPNPKAMVDSLHKANIHGMISIWPVFA